MNKNLLRHHVFFVAKHAMVLTFSDCYGNEILKVLFNCSEMCSFSNLKKKFVNRNIQKIMFGIFKTKFLWELPSLHHETILYHSASTGVFRSRLWFNPYLHIRSVQQLIGLEAVAVTTLFLFADCQRERGGQSGVLLPAQRHLHNAHHPSGQACTWVAATDYITHNAGFNLALFYL